MEKFHFVGGQTCPESVPIQGLIEAAKQVLTRRGKQLVSYPSQVNQHDELILKLPLIGLNAHKVSRCPLRTQSSPQAQCRLFH